uniref:hypothetical protein n=1 Tax=Xenorhabdus bovienii TaxID=40576 RepID=UPI0005707F29
LSESELVTPLWGEIKAAFYEGGFLLAILSLGSVQNLRVLILNFLTNVVFMLFLSGISYSS